jgi:hypothetical protein
MVVNMFNYCTAFFSGEQNLAPHVRSERLLHWSKVNRGLYVEISMTGFSKQKLWGLTSMLVSHIVDKGTHTCAQRDRVSLVAVAEQLHCNL